VKHFKLKVCILAVITVAFIAGAVMLIYTDKGTYLSGDDIDVVVSLLESKNITIDKNIIPKKTESMPQVTMSSNFSSSEDVAKAVFGNGFVSYDGVCEKNGVTIRLTPEILIKCNVPMLGKDFKNVSKKNAAKRITKALNKYDIDIAGSIVEVYDGKKDGHISVIVTQTYKGFPVFNNSLVFDVSEKGISEVSGLYFSPNEKSNQEFAVNSAADALIKFAQDIDNRGSHITGIEQGYRINANKQNMHSANVIPTWSILTDKGEVYYINAS